MVHSGQLFVFPLYIRPPLYDLQSVLRILLHILFPFLCVLHCVHRYIKLHSGLKGCPIPCFNLFVHGYLTTLCSFIFRIPESALREYNYYMDTGRLRIETSNMRNANTPEHLEMIKNRCLENLSRLPAAPGAPMEDRPPHHVVHLDSEGDPDQRGGGQYAAEVRRLVYLNNMSDKHLFTSLVPPCGLRLSKELFDQSFRYLNLKTFPPRKSHIL